MAWRAPVPAFCNSPSQSECPVGPLKADRRRRWKGKVSTCAVQPHSRAAESTSTAKVNCKTLPTPTIFGMNGNQNEDKELLLLDNKMKFVMYIPSETCSTCHISKLYLADTLFNIIPSSSLVPVIIIQPAIEQRDSIMLAIRNNWFEFPIFEDKTRPFMIENSNIPNDNLFYSFLLDKENQIIMIGDPTRNSKVMDLYIKILSEYAH